TTRLEINQPPAERLKRSKNQHRRDVQVQHLLSAPAGHALNEDQFARSQQRTKLRIVENLKQLLQRLRVRKRDRAARRVPMNRKQRLRTSRQTAHWDMPATTEVILRKRA